MTGLEKEEMGMQSKESMRLRECPFCGGKAQIWDNAWHVIVKTKVQIKCKRCGVRTMEYVGLDWDDTHYLAIEAWNRRAEDERS